MICEECRREAPTRRVKFLAVVGCIIVIWRWKSPSPLCKSCVHRTFWEYTLLTAVGGWWSILSLFLAPVVVLANVLQYVVCCVALKRVPPGAAPPQLTPEAVQRLRPFAGEIDGCLKKGVQAVQIAIRLAPLARVTPGQVMLFIWSRRRDRQLNVETGHVIEMPK
jgi:hypothetical protein